MFVGMQRAMSRCSPTAAPVLAADADGWRLGPRNDSNRLHGQRLRLQARVGTVRGVMKLAHWRNFDALRICWQSLAHAEHAQRNTQCLPEREVSLRG